jgi:hypothetical protein
VRFPTGGRAVRAHDSLLRWGRDLPYLLDGALAARLHGVPVPLTGASCLAVTVRHGDREVALRPLPDIERDDPQVARVLRRQRDR